MASTNTNYVAQCAKLSVRKQDSAAAALNKVGTEKHNVIVWEWETNIPGIFAPYNEEASNFIEQESKACKHVADLGSIDHFHAALIVDISAMQQISRYFGTRRQVRRKICSSHSAIANGIVWEWESDLNWEQYAADASTVIENCFSRCDSQIDLEKTAQKVPCTIIFDKMIQRSKFSRVDRRVRRRMLAIPYTSATSEKSNLKQKTTSDTVERSPMHMFLNGLKKVNNDDPAKKFHKLKKRQIKHQSLRNFCKSSDSVEAEMDCTICLEKLQEHSSAFGEDSDHSVVELDKCHHQFHECCLEAFYSSGNNDGSMQCPVCKTIHGIKCGIQPPGTMTVTRMASSVPGYEGHGCIQITYNIQSGIQGKNQPNSGCHYNAYGFPRIAYLPDNEKGRKVLKLLQTAWDRKLVFTIGTSVTNGFQNAVVWNEIHHKTEAFSNHSGHGYPDPNYLDNVLQELKLQGVE